MAGDLNETRVREVKILPQSHQATGSAQTQSDVIDSLTINLVKGLTEIQLGTPNPAGLLTRPTYEINKVRVKVVHGAVHNGANKLRGSP